MICICCRSCACVRLTVRCSLAFPPDGDCSCFRIWSVHRFIDLRPKYQAAFSKVYEVKFKGTSLPQIPFQLAAKWPPICSNAPSLRPPRPPRPLFPHPAYLPYSFHDLMSVSVADPVCDAVYFNQLKKVIHSESKVQLPPRLTVRSLFEFADRRSSCPLAFAVVACSVVSFPSCTLFLLGRPLLCSRMYSSRRVRCVPDSPCARSGAELQAGQFPGVHSRPRGQAPLGPQKRGARRAAGWFAFPSC